MGAHREADQELYSGAATAVGAALVARAAGEMRADPAQARHLAGQQVRATK